jgi:hypothetical protein
MAIAIVRLLTTVKIIVMKKQDAIARPQAHAFAPSCRFAHQPCSHDKQASKRRHGEIAGKERQRTKWRESSPRARFRRLEFVLPRERL